jgi:DNA polymerase I-like protein with 3'-5' exonuclease and polymerase domains
MDLAQAELRVASLYAGCEPMLQIIREGRDPHGETAVALGLASGPDDAQWKKMRGVGKRGNFSLIFGIGPSKFKADLRLQVGVDLPLQQVQGIVRDWNGLYPQFGTAIQTHMNHARRNGWTPIRDNIRRYYTDYERAIHDEHKAFNSKVQGNLGYFGRAWMVQVDQLLMQAGVDPDQAGLLLNIHDALLLMLPDTPEGQALAYQSAQIARDMWVQWFPGVPGDVDVSEWRSA